LFAEDDAGIRASVAKLLRANTFAVDEVDNGQDAYYYLLNTPYDLAVLDIMMPKMDGLTAVLKAREKGIKTPVIFLTAKDALEDRLNGLYAGAETRDEAVLEQYCRQVVEGQATGRYLYIAHPDLIHFVGRPKVYEKHMRAMLRALKDMNALIEFNMLGFIENRNYPMPAFWRMAGEEGLRAVIGLDAHRPGHFGNADALKAAQEILEHNGIPLVERLQIH